MHREKYPTGIPQGQTPPELCSRQSFDFVFKAYGLKEI
jgi:hypothetical protein